MIEAEHWLARRFDSAGSAWVMSRKGTRNASS